MNKTMPLSNKEYYALLHIFGIVNILDDCLPKLRKRRELIDAQADLELVQEFTYCPTEAIDRLVERVMMWECLSCDKSAKEAKKCPVFKDIDACFSWDQAPNGDACPYAGWMETE